jgi:hypothetical protein
MSTYPIYLVINEDQAVWQSNALTWDIVHGLEEGVYQVLRINADGTADEAYFPDPSERTIHWSPLEDYREQE